MTRPRTNSKALSNALLCEKILSRHFSKVTASQQGACKLRAERDELIATYQRSVPVFSALATQLLQKAQTLKTKPLTSNHKPETPDAGFA
jgi:hypothetical protein